MTIDKHKLAKAREWATKIGEREAPGHLGDLAEVILSLPEEIVDGDKVREVIAGHWAESEGDLLKDHLQALLPAPEPQVEIALGAWAMHPEHGKVLITSARPDSDGYVRVAWEVPDCLRETGWDWVTATELAPLPDTHDDSDPEQGSNCQADLDSSPDPQPGEAWLVRSKLTCHEVNAVLDEFDEWTGADPDGTHFNEVVENVTPLRRLVPAQEPRVLVTEHDYREAADDTIVRRPGNANAAYEKWSHDEWRSTAGTNHTDREMAENSGPRTVLWDPEA